MRDATATAGPRHRAREIALQILHQIDVGGSAPHDASQDASHDPSQMMARYFAHLGATQAPVASDDDDARTEPAARVDRTLVEELVRGVAEHRAEIDGLLTNLSRNWRLERMAIVERNVIRIALFELRYAPGVPVPVILNEAIELAKRYGTSEGVAFVNGLLDRAASEIARTSPRAG
jgi:N utilization substance protein B